MTSEEDILMAAMNSDMENMGLVDVDDDDAIDIYNTYSILATTGVDASLDLNAIEQGIQNKTDEPVDELSNTDMLMKAMSFDSESELEDDEEDDDEFVESEDVYKRQV